jgi:hypothetical protein
MFSKIFTLAARVTNFMETQKHAPRRAVNLTSRVSLAGPRQTGSGPLPPSFTLRPTLKGHTRDLSTSGLALLLPAVHLGGLYFTDGERRLSVSVDLDRTTVEMEVLPVRYERLDDGHGYLIGVRILAMSAGDRIRYDDFLSAIGSKRHFAANLATPQPNSPSLGV